MKSIFTFLVLFVSVHFSLAQTINYSEGNIEYEDQRVQTIKITLSPQIEPIDKKFESWLDDNYDVNLKDKKMLFFDREFMSAKGITVPEISDKK